MSEVAIQTVYSPLDRPKGHIRLIHLQPVSTGPEISCSLHIVDIEDAAYEAFSYEWGDVANGTERITLNGQQFPVRRALYRDLDYLREQDTVRVVWIDAISINQEDMEERNSQVRF